MTEDDEAPLFGDATAALDQAQAELCAVAPVYGAYYRALLGGGASRRLARQLVRDLHYHRLVEGRVPGDPDTDPEEPA